MSASYPTGLAHSDLCAAGASQQNRVLLSRTHINITAEAPAAVYGPYGVRVLLLQFSQKTKNYSPESSQWGRATTLADILHFPPTRATRSRLGFE